VIKVAAPQSPAVALLAPPLEAPLINKTTSSEKREEMPQELLNWRWTSDPVVVGANEIQTISEQKVWSGP
jgi:hypothetical protein